MKHRPHNVNFHNLTLPLYYILCCILWYSLATGSSLILNNYYRTAETLLFLTLSSFSFIELRKRINNFYYAIYFITALITFTTIFVNNSSEIIYFLKKNLFIPAYFLLLILSISLFFLRENLPEAITSSKTTVWHSTLFLIICVAVVYVEYNTHRPNERDAKQFIITTLALAAPTAIISASLSRRGSASKDPPINRTRPWGKRHDED